MKKQKKKLKNTYFDRYDGLMYTSLFSSQVDATKLALTKWSTEIKVFCGPILQTK